MRTVFPKLKKAKILIDLLKYRRQIGIIAFLFGLIHAALIVIKRNVDLFDLKTYQISLEGTAILIIFALLTFTSNDWSIKKMKNNWRKLHQLTYTAMFLLLWHIQEKMSGHWNFITPIELILMTVVIGLFCRRRWLEYAKEYNHISHIYHIQKIIFSVEGFILLNLLILGLVKFNINPNLHQINDDVNINNLKPLKI